jgi:hypothetical protein
MPLYQKNIEAVCSSEPEVCRHIRLTVRNGWASQAMAELRKVPSVVLYLLRYIHAASTSNTIVKTQRDELLISVFFAMNPILKASMTFAQLEEARVHSSASCVFVLSRRICYVWEFYEK